MKKEISSAPVLAYYNPKKQTMLQTDASIKGLGACLLQEEKPVYFANQCKQVFSEYGWPDTLISDNGPCYTSQALVSLKPSVLIILQTLHITYSQMDL